MACIAETLGMSLPGTAAIPAVHADRLVAAEETGKAAVRLIETQITPAQVITEKSVENAFRVLMSVGGSTNAIVHLTAIAGRLGIQVPLKRFNELSDETPVLVDLKPVGEGYMEDFHRRRRHGRVAAGAEAAAAPRHDRRGRAHARASGSTSRLDGSTDQ